ncbi:unnamed protein product [Vitrella brassicaformis CCMP3155]|uniref:Uncharacterized protein n=2 Tax=Vitrella brassicaformis TaxID=1169539 RepID=A0A0G4E9V8_VITBC|nr:unnamed protein product [Vitrella brassicaformis CCMP3155]|eukprot:CEL92224.1 unnamed protein product [Vitrella brassicaformis CCMP3155]
MRTVRRASEALTSIFPAQLPRAPSDDDEVTKTRVAQAFADDLDEIAPSIAPRRRRKSLADGSEKHGRKGSVTCTTLGNLKDDELSFLKQSHYRDVTTVFNYLLLVVLVLLGTIAILRCQAECLEPLPIEMYSKDEIPRFQNAEYFAKAVVRPRPKDVRVKWTPLTLFYSTAWLCYFLAALAVLINHTCLWRRTVQVWRFKRYWRYKRAITCDSALQRQSLTWRSGTILSSIDDGTEKRLTICESTRTVLSVVQTRMYLFWYRWVGISGRGFWVLIWLRELVKMMLQTHINMVLGGFELITVYDEELWPRLSLQDVPASTWGL